MASQEFRVPISVREERASGSVRRAARHVYEEDVLVKVEIKKSTSEAKPSAIGALTKRFHFFIGDAPAAPEDPPTG